MPVEPTKVTIRMYNVGFGDCFLLTFHYDAPLKDQHILIDFGTGGGSADMDAIAAEIKDVCGGKLYAVVATHRHRDHISGFSDTAGAKSTGAVIASCNPEVVLQPWTENPKAAPDAKSATVLAKGASTAHLYLASLDAMQGYAESAAAMAAQWRESRTRPLGVEKLAATNAKNPAASANLQKMGKRAPRFLKYGSESGLENAKTLPGVKVHVLGPPSLEQQKDLKYAKKSDQYWLAGRFWGLQQKAAAASGRVDLFPDSPRYGRNATPIQARWFVEHADAALRKNVRGIVTILDSYLNNTSLILLFEVKGRKLLFPGDAQLENWQWALSQPGIEDLLKDVDVYKVGHHGSRNATPHALWEHFEKRKDRSLTSLMSTASGVYDRSEEGKVPSDNLVDALKRESVLEDTRTLRGAKRPIEVVIE